MKPLETLFLLCLGTGFGSPLHSQTVTWFFGPSGGSGDIQSFDEASRMALPLDPRLSGIQLLPIDFVGRTRRDALLSGRPHLAEDIPGAARIALPQKTGSLYHYRKTQAGGDAYGYFRVDPTGTAQVVLERTATSDPFLPKLAVSVDGLSVLVGTNMASGGDVLEVDLVAGTSIDRTSALPALDLQPNGLALLANWGVIATTTGVLRFDRQNGATALPLSFLTPPTYFGDGVACSGNEAVAVAIAGTDAGSAHLWVFGPTGDPVCVTPGPAALSGPGYLPEAVDGPYLTLSVDGSACLWRAEEGLTSEAYIRPTQIGAPLPTQLTADMVFDDTLDSTGDFGFLDENTALFIAGEEDPGFGIEGGDVYQVDLNPITGATTIQNLSLTSGVTQPIFPKGTLKNEGGVYAVDGFDGLLIHEELSGGLGNLIVVEKDVPGTRVLRQDVSTLTAVQASANYITCFVETTSNASEFYSIPKSMTGVNVVISLPTGFLFSALETGLDDWAGVILDVPGGKWIGRINSLTGFSEVLIEAALPFGSTCGFASGSLGFHLDFSPQRALGITWKGGTNVGLFPTGNRSCFLLPIY